MFPDMHPSEPAEEFLQCYDEHGHPTQARPRSEVKQKPYRYWYGVTKIWLVNDQADLMVSRRAGHVMHDPQKWQSHFGGHVSADMSFEATAAKELFEEAGLQVKPEDLHLLAKGRNDQNKNFFALYAYRFNGKPEDLHFVDGEVTDAKWLSMDRYWGEKETFPEQWCGQCTTEVQRQIRDWVKQEAASASQSKT